MKRFPRIIGVVVMVALSGCQTLAKKETPDGKVKYVVAEDPKEKKAPIVNPVKQLTGEKPREGNPESIVAIWKDATYTVANQRPTRGFGGRLYFHDRDKNPIVVDGDLVVYGFDDRYKDDPNQVPEKRFVFTREELKHHMSVSSAGPSYSVWLPWDHINGEQKNLTLIAVFKDAKAGGRVCKSEAIPAVLPGKKPYLAEQSNQIVEEIRKLEAEKNAQQVGFEDTKPEGTKKIKSHEIRIPEGSRERLFGTVPSVSYRLPEPQPLNPGVQQASATEPVIDSRPDSPPSADSLPDRRRAQSGQFVRQGKLPPGKTPPRLGATSGLPKHR